MQMKELNNQKGWALLAERTNNNSQSPEIRLYTSENGIAMGHKGSRVFQLLYILTHLILMTLWDKYCHYPHFPDEEIKAQEVR